MIGCFALENGQSVINVNFDEYDGKEVNVTVKWYKVNVEICFSMNVKSSYKNDISEIKCVTFTNTKNITFTNLEGKRVNFYKSSKIIYLCLKKKNDDKNATYTSVKKQVTFSKSTNVLWKIGVKSVTYTNAGQLASRAKWHSCQRVKGCASSWKILSRKQGDFLRKSFQFSKT